MTTMTMPTLTNALPWFGSSTDVKGLTTSKEVIEKASLDWKVNKSPVFYDNKGRYSKIPKSYAILREDSDEVLGIVGSQYKIVQNSDAFTFFDEIVKNKKVSYESAGCVNSNKIFIVAKLNKKIVVPGTDDVSETYIVLYTSHDGSSSVHLLPTAIRLSCVNALPGLIRSSSSDRASFRHIQSFDISSKNIVESAKKQLLLLDNYFENLEDQIISMSETKITNSQAMKFFETLVPDNPNSKSNTRTKNIREKLLENFKNSINIEDKIKNSTWSALNSITEYIDHQRPSRGNSPFKQSQVRTNSILLGNGAMLKRKAFKLAASL